MLLFLADYPLEWPWLTLLAFAPFLWAILRAPRVRDASFAALVFSAARYGPLGVGLDGFSLPIPSAVGLLIYLVALDQAFALVVHRVRGARPFLFVLAVAGTYTGLELVDSLLPMYGTGRTLARLWAAWPNACGVVRLLGGPVFAFAIVALQASAVIGVERQKCAPFVAVAAGLAAVVAIALVPAPRSSRTFRVAAVGWNETSDAKNAESHVRKAAAAGAKLVVFPEVAFGVPPGGREPFERHWSAVAHEHAVALVIPFADEDRPGNRAAVFGATGRKLGEYAKHHLVPLAERFPASSEPLLVVEVHGVRVGVLICQDDNFRDLAGEYAKRGVELVVIPTFEMSGAMAPYHLRSSALRAIENGFAVVRAVAQGQSTAIAPAGTIVASFDHTRHGSGVLLVDVPLPDR